MVDLALGAGTSTETMVTGFGIVLQRQDVWTLRNSGWLYDHVSYLFSLYALFKYCLLFDIRDQLLHELDFVQI